MKVNRFFSVLAILCLFLFGAWALEYQTAPAQVEPQDFNPKTPSDYPVLTDIDIDIKGLAAIGTVYMIEGIENTTSVEASGDSFKPGRTTYPRLVIHGVFDELMRNWRDDIISGKSTTRDIELDLKNKAGKRVLRITFYDTMPIKFAIPPLSIENNTRYMERMEFVYTYFDITN